MILFVSSVLIWYANATHAVHRGHVHFELFKREYSEHYTQNLGSLVPWDEYFCCMK